jgi:hypothetical protein
MRPESGSKANSEHYDIPQPGELASHETVNSRATRSPKSGTAEQLKTGFRTVAVVT